MLDRYLSDEWMTDPTDQSVWEGVMQIPDEELWRAHERCRERLVGWARQTLRDAARPARRGVRRGRDGRRRCSTPRR